ncbi:hypothetical protein LSAT2_023676 [Lamellibrachia satsuma]|nr:hypothetical protein LSAT2_023676 [Lamellibrachia satsuma]
MELLKLLGVPNIEHLNIGKRIDYTGYNSGCGFLKVLSDVVDANLVTVLTDESTDIVVNHRLTINLRIVSPVEVKPSTHFLCDVLLHDAKGSSIFAVIKHELDTREQAAENIKAIQDFKSTVTSIYHYFYKSPTRASQMETIQNVLNDPVLKYRKVHQVRWLSFYAALEAIYRTRDSLITYSTCRENDAKAVGLEKKTAQALFIHIAYWMMDWLQPIMKLNLFFQEKDVDIARVKMKVDLCLAELEKMKSTPTTDAPENMFTAQLKTDLEEVTFKGHHKITKNAAQHGEGFVSRNNDCQLEEEVDRLVALSS